MEEIAVEIKGFIQNNILAPGVSIDNDSDLKAIGVDSFSIVEIVLFIERKFNKLIPGHLMVPETFVSVNSIANVVQSIEA